MMGWRIFLLFLTGVQSQSSTRKYFLIMQNKTWSDSRTYCQTNHNDLATIRSNEEYAQIQAVAQTQNSRAWIGLYLDMNSWKWSLGNQLVTSTGITSHWPTSIYGEPSNSGGLEECGSMSPYGWWDLYCPRLFPFACFDERNTGSARYIFYSNPKSWYDAQSYCRQYHTDLASTRDAAEYSIVFGLKNEYFWIGLFRDSWKWVDGSTSSINWWKSNQPDNAEGNENCALLNTYQTISDWSCNNLLYFYCYSSTGQRRVIRFKVRSDQDVNDLAVLAALVQKIKEKLKNHGLEKDIYVKWRKQPNGNIFNIIQ